jgi:hypothetical protein
VTQARDGVTWDVGRPGVFKPNESQVMDFESPGEGQGTREAVWGQILGEWKSGGRQSRESKPLEVSVREATGVEA